MTALRRLVLDHRALALWLALAALAVRLMVPAGFMIGQADGRVTLQICSGFGPVTMPPATHAAPMAMGAGDTMPAMAHDAAMAGHHGGDHEDGAGHAGTDMPCAYATLAHGADARTDALLLVIAIAFVMARGVAPRRVEALQSVAHLRPPSQGPPLTA